MNILIVGAEEIYSIENYYVKYLREAGVNVQVFPAQGIFYQHYKTLASKILLRVGLSPIHRRINEQLKRKVSESRPDVIWVFKGMEIFPQTLEWISSLKIKLVNYNPDNPFIFSGRGSGNKNVRSSIRLYDLHFTYNLEIKERLEKDYHCKTAWLPFGFDVNPQLYEVCQAQQELNEVCFVGNPDKHRVKFIKALAKGGVAVSVYGHHWSKFINNPLVHLHPPALGDDLWKTFARYRIQLNTMRIHNLDSHNMRTFEVPGIGGVMLAPKTKEHELFFVDKKEAFFFSDIGECIQLIKHLLLLTRAESIMIRQAARKRSLDSGYHYKNRAAQALIEIRKLTT